MPAAPTQIVKGELFGVFTHPKAARVVLLPVPWEVTSLGGSDTSFAPEAILRQSCHVNLFHPKYREAASWGYAMLPIPFGMKVASEQLRHELESVCDPPLTRTWCNVAPELVNGIDAAFAKVVHEVKSQTVCYLDQGKIVGVVGGEGSSALGCIEAMGDRLDAFGVLHIGAEANLYERCQGMRYAYASTMHHVLAIPAVSQVVQVGLRDYAEEEERIMKAYGTRFVTFLDGDLKQRLGQGATWQTLGQGIVRRLPQRVYVHLDVGGLDIRFCPNTNRPRPGGLEMEQVVGLFHEMVAQGKEIVGFDLCEVGNDDYSDWDAMVGAHLLHELSICAAVSRQRS